MKLRFYARGTAHVSDFDALERSKPLRRFVGRRLTELGDGRTAFAPKAEADEVTGRPELIKAARDGELWPADAETAKACGVPFDPTFGGELTAAGKSELATRGKENV
jgi:hypothetical protein